MKNKTSARKKWLTILGSIFLVFVAGGFYIRHSRQSAYQEKLNARKVKVTKKDVRKELFLTGKVLPASSIAVYSPVSGQLKEIFINEGDTVKKGQNLFSVLQDSTGQRELEAQRAEVDRARLDVKAAEEQRQRRRTVRDLFSDSDNQKEESDYERKQLDLQNALDKLKLLEETLGLRQNRGRKQKSDGLSLIYMRAPKDGVVTFINKFVGESVFGTSESVDSTGKEVLTLSDLDKMIVRSQVLESDLANVHVGMAAEVKLDAFRDKTYPGVISRISQQGVEDKNGSYTYFVTDVTISKPDSDVRAQMNASLQMLIAEKKEVLALPANAVASLNGHSVVELPSLRPGKPKYKEVKTGLTTEQNVEIVEGLNEGDEVLEIDFAALNLKDLAAGKLGKDEVK